MSGFWLKRFNLTHLCADNCQQLNITCCCLTATLHYLLPYPVLILWDLPYSPWDFSVLPARAGWDDLAWLRCLLPIIDSVAAVIICLVSTPLLVSQFFGFLVGFWKPGSPPDVSLPVPIGFGRFCSVP